VVDCLRRMFGRDRIEGRSRSPRIEVLSALEFARSDARGLKERTDPPTPIPATRPRGRVAARRWSQARVEQRPDFDHQSDSSVPRACETRRGPDICLAAE
jgi:hypothetical protein